MKRRTFTIRCAENHCAELAEILYRYSDVAYPPGGSDCAAASRSALLEIADKLGNNDVDVEIGSRQRPMLLAAVKWYFSEVERFSPELREALMETVSLKSFL